MWASSLPPSFDGPFLTCLLLAVRTDGLLLDTMRHSSGKFGVAVAWELSWDPREFGPLGA